MNEAGCRPQLAFGACNCPMALLAKEQTQGKFRRGEKRYRSAGSPIDEA